MKKELVIILDNIRSTYNVGSIFRTADGAGVSKVLVCGITPSPIDRFGRKRKDIAKVSLGAEDSISWEYFDKTEDAIKKLKEQNFEIVALEQDESSIEYTDYSPCDKTAVILGPEVTGLSKEILEMTDKIIEIPMKGEKESLNVSIAAGIVMYEIKKHS